LAHATAHRPGPFRVTASGRGCTLRSQGASMGPMGIPQELDDGKSWKIPNQKWMMRGFRGKTILGNLHVEVGQIFSRGTSQIQLLDFGC